MAKLNGWQLKTVEKAQILALLQEVADYVIAICKDDRALILSSGFDVTDEQTGTAKPSIESLEVILGISGQAILRARNIKGAVAYVHQYATGCKHSLAQ